MAGTLNQVLEDSHYPTIATLVFAIIDKFDDELINIAGNCSSGQYTLDEIENQIEELRAKLCSMY